MAMVEMMQTTTVWARMIPVAYSILSTLDVEVPLQLGSLINHCTALFSDLYYWFGEQWSTPGQSENRKIKLQNIVGVEEAKVVQCLLSFFLLLLSSTPSVPGEARLILSQGIVWEWKKRSNTKTQSKFKMAKEGSHSHKVVCSQQNSRRWSLTSSQLDLRRLRWKGEKAKNTFQDSTEFLQQHAPMRTKVYWLVINAMKACDNNVWFSFTNNLIVAGLKYRLCFRFLLNPFSQDL